jgi:hypothetical protein
MKQKNIIITTISVAIILLAALSTAFVILWTKGEKKSDRLATNPEQVEQTQQVIKREDLKEALIKELFKQHGNEMGLVAFKLRIDKEDDKWINGSLLGYHTEEMRPPTEPLMFLAIKNTNGDIEDLAIDYTDKFKSWLPLVPEHIIPQYMHQYLD